MADLSSYDSAFDALKAMLDEYGLGSLSGAVTQFLQDGYSQDQVSVLLQDTPEYKQRFAGNEARKAAGIPVLSAKDYLSVESAYRQILSTSGMPTGFYDQPSDFADWIGKDVAPQEISSRVSMAVSAANQMDQATKDTFQQWYGVGPNDLAAYFLDQQRALPQITKIADAAELGAAAKRGSLDVSQSQAEFYAGVPISSLRTKNQLVQQAADTASRGGALANIYHGSYTSTDALNEAFLNSADAEQKRLNLSAQERAAFAGKSGLGQGSLSKVKNY